MVEAGRRTALHDVEDFTEVSITDNNTKPTDQADDVVVVTSIANMQCREKAAPVKKQKQLSFAVVSKYACVVVGHAFLLFGLLTFIVVISLRAPMPTWQRILFITLASILNAIVFAIYWITMATPAGSAPDTYNIPDVYVLRHEQGPILGINEKAATVLPAPVHTRDRDGKLRFCRACVAVKPDRAHHCYSCGECTLRFDHHCPWMGRCIGLGNHKLFYLFTMYGTALAIFYIAATLTVAIQYFTGSVTMPTYVIALDMTILVVTFLFGGCFVGGLFVSHTLLILQNKTTFERLRPQKSAVKLPAGERLFDTGTYNNWVQVMGSNPWLWFVPVPTKPVVDGCTYPLNDKLSASIA